MKWIIAIVIACGLVFSFQYLDEKSKREKAEAAAQIAAARAESEKAQALAKEKAAAERLAALRPAMGISKLIEPLIIQIATRLDLAQPADLVPAVEITKQRILDKRVHAEEGRKPVFDRATTVLNYLIALGEERTKTLEEMLKNKVRTSTTLDRASGPSSGDFFNRNITKRWDDVLARSRPVLNDYLEQLRGAEREWNKQVNKNAFTEAYDLPAFEPVMITVDPNAMPESSLGSTPKSGQVTRPWRSGYYTRYRYTY